jgi:hypothetical protein
MQTLTLNSNLPHPQEKKNPVKKKNLVGKNIPSEKKNWDVALAPKMSHPKP